MADDDRSDIEDADLSGEVAGNAGGTDQTLEADARRAARRRVLMGGLATAPLILTLDSRPALSGGGGHWGGGKHCGPSPLMSGNTPSNNAPQGCKGKTPGDWKPHADTCGAYLFCAPYNTLTSTRWDTSTADSGHPISDLNANSKTLH